MAFANLFQAACSLLRDVDLVFGSLVAIVIKIQRENKVRTKQHSMKSKRKPHGLISVTYSVLHPCSGVNCIAK